jgi:hypothetical protein
LLAVALQSAKGVSEAERQKLLDQWERVTFRIFGLVGKDSRTKVGEYVRLGYKITTEDIETRTYNQIMAALRELGHDYPVDKSVEDGLLKQDWYESPDACRYLLWNYEEHLAKSAGAGATFDEQERSAIWKLRASDSIEHVHPQNPGPGWAGKMVGDDGEEPLERHVGRIGNLLLLPIRLNSEAKARPFAEKKQIYLKHNLRMVKEVTPIADWNLGGIIEREAKMAVWAKTRWADI